MRVGPDSTFELPKTIDRNLAALSKHYGQQGQRQLEELIVNSQVRIHEAWSRDNWNGGIYGHALYLVVPEPLFIASLARKDDIQKQIKADLNRLHNVQNEFVEEVFVELEGGEEHEWRKASGLLLAGSRTVTPNATKRIWGDVGFRLFLSHKSEVKKETAALKDELAIYGVSCFVAHEDITPTKEWQDEIEHALSSMDGFAALMTENFHESDWTDQEVGFALARGVPLIAVRLGMNPYGFIGKFQGLASSWATAAADIAKVLIQKDRMISAYTEALRKCTSWERGNRLAAALPGIESLSSEQIDALVAAYNETSEVRGSFGFNGTNSRFYGCGLVEHLNRLGTRQFKYGIDRQIEGEP